MAQKTEQEIEELKETWLKDPQWDIEETEGFEDHYEDLKAYRLMIEAQAESALKKKRKERAEYVRFVTGIGNADEETLQSLMTWKEIVHYSHRSNREGDRLGILDAQVNATLLQAAQLKRIADALEKLSEK